MRFLSILAIVLLLVLSNTTSDEPDYLFNAFSISSLSILVFLEARRGGPLNLPYGVRFQLGLLSVLGALIYKTTGSKAYTLVKLAEIERRWFKKRGVHHSLLSELLKGKQPEEALRHPGDETSSPELAVKTFLSDLEKELSKTLVLREDKMSVVLALGLFIPVFMALIHGLIGVKNLTYLAISLVAATRLITRRLVAQ